MRHLLTLIVSALVTLAAAEPPPTEVYLRIAAPALPDVFRTHNADLRAALRDDVAAVLNVSRAATTLSSMALHRGECSVAIRVTNDAAASVQAAVASQAQRGGAAWLAHTAALLGHVPSVRYLGTVPPPALPVAGTDERLGRPALFVFGGASALLLLVVSPVAVLTVVYACRGRSGDVDAPSRPTAPAPPAEAEAEVHDPFEDTRRSFEQFTFPTEGGPSTPNHDNHDHLDSHGVPAPEPACTSPFATA